MDKDRLPSARRMQQLCIAEVRRMRIDHYHLRCRLQMIRSAAGTSLCFDDNAACDATTGQSDGFQSRGGETRLILV